MRLCKCSIFSVITLTTLNPDISCIEIGVDPAQIADSQLTRIHIVFHSASIKIFDCSCNVKHVSKSFII